MSPFVYRQEHSPASARIREEVFGPHVALIPFKTIDDAVRIYNDTEYGLSMAVITENYRTMRHVPRRMRVRHGLRQPALHRRRRSIYRSAASRRAATAIPRPPA